MDKQEDDVVMAKLDVVHRRLAAGKLGPAARLRPTTVAKRLWKAAIHPW